MKEIGYYSSAEETTPTYDPGVNVKCLACKQLLSAPMKTISFRADDNRSYFYRLHAACATEENQGEIEGPIVEAICEMQESGNSNQWGEA